jgi:lipopolysaccharide transport system ATP-binding protein
VKRYSSGMSVRLAFAVAAHLEAEILVVDEVLAVGDAAFQKKCLGKMGEVAKGGRTVFLVSHNMGVMCDLTQRCVYLENGHIAALGDSQTMVEMYLKRALHAQSNRHNGLEFYRRKRNPDSPVKIVGIGLNGYSLNSGSLPDIRLGETFNISIDLQVFRPLHGALCDIELKNSRGDRVTVLVSIDQDYSIYLEPGRHELTAQVNGLPLAPGEYFADVGINQSTKARAYDVIHDFPVFRVVNSGQITHWLDRQWGVLHCNSVQWRTRNLTDLN